jgi:hypothetical protein
LCHTILVTEDLITVISSNLAAADCATNPSRDDGSSFDLILINSAGLTGMSAPSNTLNVVSVSWKRKSPKAGARSRRSRISAAIR